MFLDDSREAAEPFPHVGRFGVNEDPGRWCGGEHEATSAEFVASRIAVIRSRCCARLASPGSLITAPPGKAISVLESVRSSTMEGGLSTGMRAGPPRREGRCSFRRHW